MVARWHNVGEQVLNNFAMPIAWSDLDLSAYVGAQTTWVLIAISPDAGTGRISFRPKGDGDDWSLFGTLTEGIGTSSCQYQTGSAWGSVFVQTSAAGIVEWEASAANQVDVYLIGYVDGFDIGPQHLHDGALPGAWTTLNAGAWITSPSVAMLKHNMNAAMAANGEQLTRPRGDAANWEDASVNTGGNTNKAANIPINGTFSLLALTDDVGVIDLFSGVASTDIDLMSWVGYGNGLYPAYTGHHDVYSITDEAPNSYVDLDLSQAIGERRALVFLKVVQGLTNSIHSAKFRDNDYEQLIGVNMELGWFGVHACSFNSVTGRASMAIVSTDENGVCEWDTYNSVGHVHFGVSVLGFIPYDTPAGPRVVDKIPYGATSDQPEKIEVTIDGDWELDPLSVGLTIIDPVGIEYDAIVAGVVQAGFTGAVTDLTTRIVATVTSWPDNLLLNGRLWTFRASCEDVVGQVL